MRSFRAHRGRAFIGIPILHYRCLSGADAGCRTINVISLAGVPLAIGIDPGQQHRGAESIELERTPWADRLQGCNQRFVEGKVMASRLALTLTTIMVFLPCGFLSPEEAGKTVFPTFGHCH